MENIPSSPFEPNSPIEIDSETETVKSTSSLSRKKRRTTTDTTKTRNNQSHTSYFFRLDPVDPSITYCKICADNLAGTQKKPYPYHRKGGNTTNLINHLRDKHNISKNNYLNYLGVNNEVHIIRSFFCCIFSHEIY
jgi:hypothetical protein